MSHVGLVWFSVIHLRALCLQTDNSECCWIFSDGHLLFIFLPVATAEVH